MSTLRIHVLGAPQIWIDEQPVTFEARKGLALLLYLSVTREIHSRDTLATLLWPGYDQKQARAYLRHGLWVLKKAVGDSCLTITREHVGLRATTDLEMDLMDFQQRLAQVADHAHAAGSLCPDCLGALREAVNCYSGDFLAGFTLPDAPDFDEWQFFQSESLRQSLIGTLERLVQGYIEQEQHEKALPYARRWLSLDPLHEPAQHHLILLYWQSGQQAAALRQYEEYVSLLQDEFGALPDADIKKLYERIKAKPKPGPTPQASSALTALQVEEQAPPVSNATSSPTPLTQTAPVPISASSSAIPSNLPTSVKPFFGRDEERRKLQRLLLQEDAARLIAIVGPGGVGKTRLAIEVARELIGQPDARHIFADGVLFVSLTSVNAANGIVTAIAEALQLSLYDHALPRQQLLAHLRGRHLLLLLDNFEQLLVPAQRAESLSLLTDLLSIDSIKLLTTSRDTLYLQHAWLQPLEGLSFPRRVDVSDQVEAEFSAIALFAQHARRMRPDFSLADEQEHVVRICQLVGGVPLALELAATWLRALSAQRIATEIERNLDILMARSQDLPERHRSMRAVIEQSWAYLDDQERTVLMRLSIFRGGFNQEAAAQIAEATLATLVSLIDRSLLQFDGVARYDLHELIRQFADEKLKEKSADVETVLARHSRYYMNFLHVRAKSMASSTLKVVLREVQEELDNVQSAWARAIALNAMDAIEQGWEVLYHFYRIRCLSQEGDEAFGRLVEHLRDTNTVALLQQALSCQGAFCISLSRYKLALELLEESLSLARQLEDRREEAMVLIALGDANKLLGEYAAAKQQFHASWMIFQEIDEQLGIAQSLNRLAGYLDEDEADYEQAEQYYEQSLAIYRRLDHPAEIARCLDKLGHNNWRRGNYAEAGLLHNESLSIYRELDDPVGIANNLGGLGLIALCRGGTELDRAEALMQESLAVCRQASNRYEEANRLRLVAMVYNSLGNYERGRQYAQEGLTDSYETGYEQGVIVNLLSLGEALCGLGERAAASKALLQAMQRANEKSKIAQSLECLLYWAELLLAENKTMATDIENQPPISLLQAREILMLVYHHHSSWHYFQERAARLLAQHFPDTPEEKRMGEREERVGQVVVEILAK